ncbi:hypothetical protein OIDMADRAFT_60365 [Oidiodendron maius Zn]|uniref:Folylpolyglutamate synthase n=1 Tax=Oidiodendron maius (strain Zn) TaxID=913774 RepID=A0A0C3GT76_OIDMZ|nr:hypothetical protein OIDMADRAFT_60365 [Oidiodendron maius Zn]
MAPRDTYSEAISKLNSLESNSQVRQRFIKDGANFEGLIPQMREWCRECGYNMTDIDRLNAIHISGSKGKGSTSAFIFSILSQYLNLNGKRQEDEQMTKLGLYTSPHLHTIRERIRLRTTAEELFSSTVISEELFGRYYLQVWESLQMEKKSRLERPSFFKFVTLTALHTFLQEGVDTAIVEVGVGGEYDSTNVLHRPSVCAITSLGLDHTDVLGKTIEEIAWHKSGILKEGCPAYTVEQSPDIMVALRRRAAERNVCLQVISRHPDIDIMPLGLAGDFQKINASLAIAVAADHLRQMGYLDVPHDIMDAPLPEKFRRGLSDASWPGRCETRWKNGVAWCLDGAHTVESIQLVGAWFASKIQQDSLAERILIFNQQTRDAVKLLHDLRQAICTSTGSQSNWKPFSHIFFCTNIAWSKDKTFGSEQMSMMDSGKPVGDLQIQHRLAEFWKSMPGERDSEVTVVRTVEEAINSTRRLFSETRNKGTPQLSLITGSLHLVGSASEVLGSSNEPLV